MKPKTHAVLAPRIRMARDFITRNWLDPEKWDAIQTHSALAGRGFDQIIVIHPDFPGDEVDADKIGHLRTRLFQGGELIVVR